MPVMSYSPPPVFQELLVFRQDRTVGAALHALRGSDAFPAVGPRRVRVPECGETAISAARVQVLDVEVIGAGGSL